MTSTIPAAPHRPREARVERILPLTVSVYVTVAERKMPIEGIVGISAGTIIEFGVPFDAELILRVGDQTIGYGQAVKVGENFGVRITRMATPKEVRAAMRR